MRLIKAEESLFFWRMTLLLSLDGRVAVDLRALTVRPACLSASVTSSLFFFLLAHILDAQRNPFQD